MDQIRRYEEHEIHSISAALYEGGWRAEDKEWLMEEYKYTEEEAEQVCKRLKILEEWEEKEDI